MADKYDHLFQEKSKTKSFFNFSKLITLQVAQVLFGVFTFFIILSFCSTAFFDFDLHYGVSRIGMVLSSAIMHCFVYLIVRVMFEFTVVVFSIFEELKKMNSKIE